MAPYNSRSEYLKRESRRQEKKAGKFLVGLFIFAALYNLGSQSKAPPAQTSPGLVAPAPVPAQPMEVMQAGLVQAPTTDVVSLESVANANDASRPQEEGKSEEGLSADTPLSPASSAHCDHDPGTAVGILNLPGHPKDGQLVCAKPGDPNISKWL